MSTEILISIVTAGALYGLGMAVLHANLNMMFISSLRTPVMMGLYMFFLYPVLYFIPFALICYLMLFFVSGQFLLSYMLSCSFLFIAVLSAVHLKFYKNLLLSKARSLIAVLTVVSFISFFAMAFWKDHNYIVLVLAAACFLFSLIATAVFGKKHAAELAKRSAEQKAVKSPKPVERKKLFWIGVDSATWDVMGPMSRNGDLPAFTAIAKEGCKGNLKSFIPTHSPVIWTTKATGKFPLKHGIPGFIALKILGMTDQLKVMSLDVLLNKAIAVVSKLGLLSRRPISSADRKTNALWNILSQSGYKVGVVSWFVTEPIEEINGFMVPEFYYMLRKESRVSNIHPASVENDLLSIRARMQDRFESEEGNIEVKNRFKIINELSPYESHKIEILKFFYFQDVLRKEVTDYLLKNIDVDVLMVYFHSVDAIQHHFWKFQGINDSAFKDVISSSYMFMDEIIGSIKKQIPGDASIFITSDHGHGPCSAGKKLFNTISGKGTISGDHSSGPDGIIIAAGPLVNKEREIEGISVQDIVPTILPLLNLPVGEDMDGHPATEIYFDKAVQVMTVPSYDNVLREEREPPVEAAESQEVMERLKSLGYIE